MNVQYLQRGNTRKRGHAGNPTLEVERDQRRQTGVNWADAREDVHYTNDYK
jgi:hypothetical protein